jgi:hypothetical protein
MQADIDSASATRMARLQAKPPIRSGNLSSTRALLKAGLGFRRAPIRPRSALAA